jgi:deoxyribonuclease-4
MIRDVGLDALEYAAVYGLRMGEEAAKRLGTASRDCGIVMSMHAPYYISLVSKSQQTRKNSIERLVKSLKFAPLMNVTRIVFHVGGYSGLTPGEAYPIVKSSLLEVLETMGHQTGGGVLAPETAGKLGVFGSIEELVRLCNDVEGLIPTIDWAHLHAITQGHMSDKKGYLDVLGTFERALGSRFVNSMHFHVSGIEFTLAGEKAHRPLGESWGPDILPLMEVVSENGYKPTFISETPEPILGAIYAKLLLEELEKSKS